jgi:hypothetical protein
VHSAERLKRAVRNGLNAVVMVRGWQEVVVEGYDIQPSRLCEQLQQNYLSFFTLPDEAGWAAVGQKLTFLSSELTFFSSKLAFLSSRGYPLNTGCLPLSYSGNPGVNGVSHRSGLVQVGLSDSACLDHW